MQELGTGQKDACEQVVGSLPVEGLNCAIVIFAIRVGRKCKVVVCLTPPAKMLDE